MEVPELVDDSVEVGPDGYGSDTTHTGMGNLTDSSSSEDEAQCERACTCKAKVPRRKARRNRRAGQKTLDELNEGEKDLLEKFLDDLDDVKETLKPLKVIEPEGVNELEDKGEWEEIEMAVDSGATETVVNEDDLPSIEVKAGAASRRGTEYEVANGVRIPNLGEKKFVAYTEEGSMRSLTAQVCDVNKPLLSVRKVMAGGSRVVFDEDGSYIESKATGERTWLKESGGMFMLKMWVQRTPF
jgi:hypothetical protein